jgi:nitrogen fixation NifU-like protein
VFELNDLYQELILDHNKHLRNLRKPDGANCEAEGYNLLCGDKIVIYLRVENNIIMDVGFQGTGCAISKASASLLTEGIKGKNKTEAMGLFKLIHAFLTGDEHEKIDGSLIGKLSVLEGVRKFPTRVKCATLAWHTLKATLENHDKIIIVE